MLEGILVTSVILVRVSASKEKALGMDCGSWGIAGARDEALEGTKTLGYVGTWVDLEGTSVTSAILGRISASEEKVLGMVCGSWGIVGARDKVLVGISVTSVMLVRV